MWIISIIYLLKSFQRPRIYLLRLDHLVLIVVENSQIVNRIQRRYILCTLYLLLPFQRPYIYRLRFGYLFLNVIENSQIVNRI